MVNPFPVGYQPAQIYYPQYQTYPQYNTQVPIQQTQIQQTIPQNSAQNQTPKIYQPAGSNITLVTEDMVDKWVLNKGETVILFDQNKPVFYVKSVNEQGMPLPLEICEYTRKVAGKTIAESADVKEEQPVKEETSEKFVTADEFEKKINELTREIFRLSSELEGKNKEKEDEKHIIVR